ncbi:hypothetical protein ABPG72_014148 [Tetrahymena utriculariae]
MKNESDSNEAVMIKRSNIFIYSAVYESCQGQLFFNFCMIYLSYLDDEQNLNNQRKIKSVLTRSLNTQSINKLKKFLIYQPTDIYQLIQLRKSSHTFNQKKIFNCQKQICKEYFIIFNKGFFILINRNTTFSEYCMLFSFINKQLMTLLLQKFINHMEECRMV